MENKLTKHLKTLINDAIQNAIDEYYKFDMESLKQEMFYGIEGVNENISSLKCSKNISELIKFSPEEKIISDYIDRNIDNSIKKEIDMMLKSFKKSSVGAELAADLTLHVRDLKDKIKDKEQMALAILQSKNKQKSAIGKKGAFVRNLTPKQRKLWNEIRDL